jgi:hypothetical protein
MASRSGFTGSYTQYSRALALALVTAHSSDCSSHCALALQRRSTQYSSLILTGSLVRGPRATKLETERARAREKLESHFPVLYHGQKHSKILL